MRHTKRQVNQLEKADYSLIKSGLLSMIMGGGVAFIFLILYLIISSSIPFSLLQMIGIIIGSSLVSGIVGVGGYYIDQLLVKYGIINNIIRQVLVLLTAIIFVGGISAFFFISLDLYQFEPLFLLIGLGGFIVATVAMIVDYNLWKMRKKVLALEIENQYLEVISKKEELLEETTRNLIVSQERNRMARDLHDSISQGLHGIKYSIYSLRQKAVKDDDSSKITNVIDHLEETTDETLKELRSMIQELKPSTLEEKGLSRAVRAHAQLFSDRQGIEVVLDIEEVNALSPEQELAVYRIVQESLNNVQKHSDADQVDLRLKEEEHRVFLIVKDNGRGFAIDHKRGHGLRNMQERVFRNNGKIDINSRPGSGTTIRVGFEILQ